MGRRTSHDPGRAALAFGPGDPDGPDLARRVPPGVPADRGLIGSIINLLGLDLATPDHTTLSRRAATLGVPRLRSDSNSGAGNHAEPVHSSSHFGFVRVRSDSVAVARRLGLAVTGAPEGGGLANARVSRRSLQEENTR